MQTKVEVEGVGDGRMGGRVEEEEQRRSAIAKAYIM